MSEAESAEEAAEAVDHVAALDEVGGNGADSPQPGLRVLRGELPLGNQMEELQKAYVAAVAAAAGCNVGKWNVDDGLDFEIKHRSAQHQRELDMRLDVQLKATHQVLAADRPNHVAIRLSNDRYKLFANPDPLVHKIVIAMILPRNVQDWIRASHDQLAVHHCMYWVSIRGKQPTGRDETVVRVPTEQVFDDVALCGIMERVGQGGVP